MIKSLSLQNFKGVTANYVFGPGTLIQGRNFSGKTAIADSIRSLVNGYIPGVSKTPAGLKMFASDYPMSIGAQVLDNALEVTFEKVKSTVKQTADVTLGDEIDEATRVLFDPSIFFNLADAARITKACELVQSKGVSADDISLAIASVLGIDTTPNKVVAEEEPMWPLYERWLNEVKSKAKTVSDLLTDSDAFWKAERKIVNAEKARMQSTVEGVADLNAADSKALPARDEVERYKAKAEADLTELRARISAAEAIAGTVARASQRRAEIAPLAADLAFRIAHEICCAKDVASADADYETAVKALDTCRTKLSQLNKQAADAKAAQARRDQLTADAAKGPTLVEAIAANEAKITELEAKLFSLREQIAAADKKLANAQTEANAPKAVRAEEETRTDDFSTGAERGARYLANALISLSDEGEVVVHSVESWRKLTAETQESEEEMRMKEYELNGAVTEALEEVQALVASERRESSILSAEKITLQHNRSALTRAEVAAEQLAALTDSTPAPDQTEIVAAEKATQDAQASVNAAKTKLHNLRTDHMTARDAVATARSANDELTRLDSAEQHAVTAPEEIDAMKKNVEILSTSIREASATLAEITAHEQDQKRITEAAEKREKVEAEYKLMGKVLDVLTQKKTELVSGSIEAPLAIANKLAAGILKGPLVFEEGEIGMRVGDKFVSGRVFSGTESAIIMMGLTAGLANRSKLRVLMLDELGTIGPENIPTLFENLAALVRDGSINQFFLFGTNYREIREAGQKLADRGDLSIIDV